jgi:hypothetical protein
LHYSARHSKIPEFLQGQARPICMCPVLGTEGLNIRLGA